MKAHKVVAIEEARKLIAGEEFDKQEWERQHLIALTKSAEQALAEIRPEFYGNLKKTVSKYLENHRDTANLAEFRALQDVYRRIPGSGAHH